MADILFFKANFFALTTKYQAPEKLLPLTRRHHKRLSFHKTFVPQVTSYILCQKQCIDVDS